VVVVGVAVQVVAMDSQAARHHHALDWAPAPVLRDGRAAVVSIRLPGEQRRKVNVTCQWVVFLFVIIVYHILLCDNLHSLNSIT